MLKQNNDIHSYLSKKISGSKALVYLVNKTGTAELGVESVPKHLFKAFLVMIVAVMEGIINASNVKHCIKLCQYLHIHTQKKYEEKILLPISMGNKMNINSNISIFSTEFLFVILFILLFN